MHDAEGRTTQRDARRRGTHDAEGRTAQRDARSTGTQRERAGNPGGESPIGGRRGPWGQGEQNCPMEGRAEVGVEPGLWGASGLVVVDGEEAHGNPWSPIGRQEEKYSAICTHI